MQIETVNVETYADEIFGSLTDVTIDDHAGALVTHGTHPDRGALTIVQAFPFDKVLIFTAAQA